MKELFFDHFSVVRGEPVPGIDLSAYSEERAEIPLRFHRSLPAYAETPLVSLRGLAEQTRRQTGRGREVSGHGHAARRLEVHGDDDERLAASPHGDAGLREEPVGPLQRACTVAHCLRRVSPLLGHARRCAHSRVLRGASPCIRSTSRFSRARARAFCFLRPVRHVRHVRLHRPRYAPGIVLLEPAGGGPQVVRTCVLAPQRVRLGFQFFASVEDVHFSITS